MSWVFIFFVGICKYSPFIARIFSSEIPNSTKASSRLPSCFSLARFFISSIWLFLITPFLANSSKKLIVNLVYSLHLEESEVLEVEVEVEVLWLPHSQLGQM